MDVSSGGSTLLCRKPLAICILLGITRRTNQGEQSIMKVRDNSNEITIVAAKNMRAGPLVQCYTLLHTTEKSKHFEAAFVKDHAPPDAKRIYDYMTGLVVPCKRMRCTYTGKRNHLHFLWKFHFNVLE